MENKAYCGECRWLYNFCDNQVYPRFRDGRVEAKVPNANNDCKLFEKK